MYAGMKNIKIFGNSVSRSLGIPKAISMNSDRVNVEYEYIFFQSMKNSSITYLQIHRLS